MFANSRRIPAAFFETHCLEVLDEVANTGKSVVITRSGRVLGVVQPPPKHRLAPAGALKDWFDHVDEDLIGSTG